MAAIEVPRFDLNLADRELVRDPYPTLKKIRELGPVVYNELLSGGYMVTRFPGCQKVMGNSARFVESPKLSIDAFGDVVFGVIDARTRHDELRGLWQREFTRENLREKRRAMIAEVVERHTDLFVDRVLSGESVDAVVELTRQSPPSSSPI